VKFFTNQVDNLMGGNMKLIFKPIMPHALRERLLRQNPERVSIQGKMISARQVDGDEEFLFKLMRGKYPPGTPQIIPGIPYRVQVFEAEVPMFPAGWLDYRIISNGPRSSAVMDVSHDSGNNDKVAIRVMEEVRNRFRGIGRSMSSIALNHMATEGVKRSVLHDVLAIDFFKQILSDGSYRIFVHRDDGQRSSDPEDKDTTSEMTLYINHESSLPRIQISLRTEPVLT
jgi:hypothetical protein